MLHNRTETSSAGHKLGQLIGDWFEEFLVLPLLTEVANKLSLFADSRFVKRHARREKIVWEDEIGNSVDYDFVLELDGTSDKVGIPVAFIECFWRRGSRHSKDKARDDSGKLIPMRTTYPTARFLGIVSAGDFTAPARELVKNHGIDLFYVPKEKIVEAFLQNGLVMDYPDATTETEKAMIASEFERAFSQDKKKKVANSLIDLIGKAAVHSYVDRVKARLSALPQEVRLVLQQESTPLIFGSLNDVSNFLLEPLFKMDNPRESFLYQITFSDGTEFEQSVNSVENLRTLHSQIQRLSEHMECL